MAGLATAVRAARSRAGTSGLILAVAALAVAAAAAGPSYYRAGQTSILRDTVASQPVLGRSYEVSQTGLVSMSLAPTEAEVAADLGSTRTLFEPPVEARQATAYYLSANESLLLASTAGLCAHLRIQGTCPTAAGQIVVSAQLATSNRWRTGQTVQLAPWGALTITGTYLAPAAADAYWAAQLETYFPYEYGGSGHGQASQYDALFAAPTTLLHAPSTVQGTMVIDGALDAGRLLPADVGPLASRLELFSQDPTLQGQGAVLTGAVPTTMTAVQASWRSLAVSVLVVTLELVAVAALLLWTLVTDAGAARGPEIALAKIRGYGRLRLSVFALGELGVIMVAAVPLGVVVGWGATVAISSGLLRPGTPVGLPGLGWVAGAVAALGGLVAVAAAVRPTVRRTVMEQWGRASRRPARPGWTFDAVVTVGAAAGLAEVVASGSVDSAHQHPLAVLVPGLVGLAVAVVASRLLPVVCGLGARRVRRGGPVAFLALRQLSRRPGALRTTTVLATAFALASFAVSAWSVARSNYATAADTEVGAPTVLDVTVPAGADLGTLVRRADPTGRHATAVEEYSSGGATTVAVDPASWGHVALPVAGGPSPDDLAAIDPPEPPPLTLTGPDLRLDVRASGIEPAGTALVADVLGPGAGAPTPVQFPALATNGTAVVTAALPPCPCVLEDLTLDPPPVAFADSHLQGSLTVTGMATDATGVWTPLPASLIGADRWYPGPVVPDTVTPAPGGFTWSFQAPAGAVSIGYRDRPLPLPAVADVAVASRPGPFAAPGLGGTTLPAVVIGSVATVPGAPGSGVLVDLDYALLASDGDATPTRTQVWVAGAPGPIEERLAAEGVAVDGVTTAASTTAGLRRSGPGLADTLFLAEAVTAAILAAGTSIVALYLSARRRRYELAALRTVGVGARQLLASVLVEQVVLVAYGAVVGVVAGLGSAAVLLRDVPEFATAPAGVSLATFPPLVPLGPVLVGGFVAVVCAAAAAAVALVAGTELTQLREAPA